MIYSLTNPIFEVLADVESSLPAATGSVPYVTASHIRSSSSPHERHTAKEALVRTLLLRGDGEVFPKGNLRSETRSFNEEIRLSADRLGKPILFLGDQPGPAVSFTHCGLKTWAVLATGNCAVGIDAACENEFGGEYPFHRAFSVEELDSAVMSLNNDAANTAAVVWSAKEAAVKALGCAFWLVDPLDVRVGRWSGSGNRFMSKVNLSERAAQRFPSSKFRPLCVRTFREDEVWLSVAVITQSS